jgi:8-oxo-dGTP pyrophosphatase MutT (NUDIX family)
MRLLDKTKETKLVDTAVFTVVEKEFKDIDFKPVGLNCKDWVMVIAKDTKDKDPVCIFVKQTRWGVEHSTIEFPCGTVDLNETPLEAAIREFKEETGIELTPSNLTLLTSFNPNPAYFNNKMHVFEYVDKGLINKFLNKKKQKLDKTEDCEVFISRLSSQKALLNNGGMSLIGMLLTEREND